MVENGMVYHDNGRLYVYPLDLPWYNMWFLTIVGHRITTRWGTLVFFQKKNLWKLDSIYSRMTVYIYIMGISSGNTYMIPVVPHKAVAEVSEEETYRRGWLL